MGGKHHLTMGQKGSPRYYCVVSWVEGDAGVFQPKAFKGQCPGMAKSKMGPAATQRTGGQVLNLHPL